MLSGILNFIQFIGLWFGLIPPAILTLLEFGPQRMLLMAASYILINATVQNMIPLLTYGQQMWNGLLHPNTSSPHPFNLTGLPSSNERRAASANAVAARASSPVAGTGLALRTASTKACISVT